MPPGLRALVSPLSSLEATQLLINIDAANRQYLPAHATAFCKTARIQCAPGSKPHEKKKPQEKKATTSLEVEDAPPNKFFYAYEKPLEKKASTSLASLEDAQPNVFLYAYEKPLEKKASTSLEDAPPNVFLYAYEKPLEKAAFPQTLETHSLENTKANRLLTSTNVHEFSSVFFREHQMVRGAEVHVQDNIGGGGERLEERAFLPRKLAKLFPIAGDGAKIARMLGVWEEGMQESIDVCKSKHEKEERKCVTSMEELADFAWSILGGSNMKAIRVYDSMGNASRGKVMNAGNSFHVQDVKILKGDPDERSVACHDLKFPFRIFACHHTKPNKILEVTLRGVEDGSLHERIAVCHYDTSYWGPKHAAFAVLHTRPGESEVCHWLGTSWTQPNGWVFFPAAI